MKNLLAGVALLFITPLAAAALTRPPSQTPGNATETVRTPVVVELFTSEGCSSCPPADALLARLAEEPIAGNVELIALEEHVDYWDNQGWVDPFSSPDWTLRQNVYAGTLGNVNPYTPQMVVDGTVEFVGNHSEKTREAILKAASKTKTPVMVAQGIAKGNRKENLTVNVGKLESTTNGDAAEVWLAVTEMGLHSAVTRGENAGQELHHAAVVRSLRKLGETKADRDTSFAGEASFPLKKEWKSENLRAVVFVQERKSRRILGAAEIRIVQ